MSDVYLIAEEVLEDLYANYDEEDMTALESCGRKHLLDSEFADKVDDILPLVKDAVADMM